MDPTMPYPFGMDLSGPRFGYDPPPGDYSLPTPAGYSSPYAYPPNDAGNPSPDLTPPQGLVLPPQFTQQPPPTPFPQMPDAAPGIGQPPQQAMPQAPAFGGTPQQQPQQPMSFASSLYGSAWPWQANRMWQGSQMPFGMNMMQTAQMPQMQMPFGLAPYGRPGSMSPSPWSRPTL